jgi:hypothetical protein
VGFGGNDGQKWWVFHIYVKVYRGSLLRMVLGKIMVL